MADEILEVTVSEGVANVSIKHPPTNLVDAAFIRALIQLLDGVEGDDDLRVLVFTSADPDFFLMHGDVDSLLAVPTGSYTPASAPNAAAAIFERLRTSRLVSIGVIDGAARGGGAEFLTALDLRYGSPRAVLGQPEVPMGILPGAGGTVRLPRLLGRGRALEIILTGRDVGAEEAVALGWLDGVVPSDQLLAYVRGLARRMAAMPAGSISAVKRVVDRSLGSIEEALIAETDALGALMAAGGHVAPMKRFLEAGGQSRVGESSGMAPIVDAMVQGA